MKIKTDIHPVTILRTRGLGDIDHAQLRLASTVKRLCDPYVPMRQGILKNTAQIAPDGRTITYGQPYAHYQYYSEVMAGRAPKRYTGKPIDYHSSPMRGPRWDKRMLADHKREIEADLAGCVGGRPK